MPKWENSIDIMRPSEAVFDFVLDPTQAERWHIATATMRKLTEGKAKVGTRYALTLNVPGSQREVVTEITEYEANRRVTFATVSGPMPFVEQYMLHEVEDGTRLTEIGEVKLSGVMRLLSPMISAFQRRNSANGLRKAKAILEAGK